jgi:hypothetical protein
VAWLARTVLTEEEHSQIRFIALELAQIRRQINQLHEVLATLNDKKFEAAFKVEKEDFSEKQLDKYEFALLKKADKVEDEFR